MTGALLFVAMGLTGVPAICESAIAKLAPNPSEIREGEYTRSPSKIWWEYERELGTRMEAQSIPLEARQGVRETCKGYAIEWLKKHT